MFDSSHSSKLGIFCGVTLTAALLSASAAEFPLSFKTINAQEVMAFPGGNGLYGQLSTKKPADLKAEPKPVSKHPLYGKAIPLGTQNEQEGILFRVDESQGDGKGYDQIIFDLNKNGDLTDDPAGARPKGPRTTGADVAVYGPIESRNTVAGSHPVYYAQVYVFYTSEMLRQLQNIATVGQVRLKPAWYLETTVEFNGTKQKIGIYDGNANERLGEVATTSATSTELTSDRYLYTLGDTFVVDRNGSGNFESDMLGSERVPFGNALYLGPTPCKVALVKDCAALSVEPWTEPLAEVALQPHGEQVCAVQLTREEQGKLQALNVIVANGKIQVPPGDYRLNNCSLMVKTAKGEPLALFGTVSTRRKAQSYTVGATNVLLCGAPLQVQTEASKQSAQTLGSSTPASRDDSEWMLRINSHVVGQGGELYSAFGQGDKLRDDPKKPTFTITSTDGTKLASGNLEFG